MKGGRFGSIREVFAVGPDTAPHNTSNLVIKRQATVASNANEDDDEKDKDGEGADGTHEVSNSNPKKKVPAWLTSLADKVLGEAQALNPNEGDDTTNFLLRNRPPFDNNIEVSSCVLPIIVSCFDVLPCDIYEAFACLLNWEFATGAS